MASTFPVDWEEQPCFLIAIPRPLVPFVGGLMAIAEKRGFWSSVGDYERGYTAVLQFERCLMSACLDDFMQKQDAFYRLVNTAVFGVTYATVSTDPLVVTPAIAPHVTLDVHDQDSIMGRLDRVTQLIDNSINGTETPLYNYDPSVKALLQSVIDALVADDTDLESILSQLEIIAALVA